MSDITDQAAQQNRQAWDSKRRLRDEGFVNIRPDSARDILAGKRFLYSENLDLSGNVRGKRLLDMGCGDGTEMLEWALAGATVTDVDNSPVQLAAARRNAEKLSVECSLVQADLLRLPENLLRGEFDIVFSAWVEAWIGDLERWFGSVYRALKPGGRLFLNSGHPLSQFVQEVEDGEAVQDSYFDEGPFTFGEQSADSWNPAGDSVTKIEWAHTLGSMVTAVARSGLRIDALLELPDNDETRADYGVGYGVKGRPGRFILAATKVGTP
jgi:SAM-dependent methyltransferase